MDEELTYLKGALGLEATAAEWDGTEGLPLFLKSGTNIGVIDAAGSSFLLVRPTGNPSLPDLKRLHAHLSKRIDLPVAVSAPRANARQRKALISQGIPFVCARRQAFLPFLGVSSTEWGKARIETPQKKKLPPKAQQAAIWGAVKGSGYPLGELRSAAGMGASQASEAVGELVERGVARRSKTGREVTVSPIGTDELLDDHMASLSSPTLRTLAVRRTPRVDALPDAGETALAARTMLNPPSVVQKAAPRAMLEELLALEVLEGELPDDETAEVQIWRYGPLFAGREDVDDVSLALSLAGSGDERIEGEVDSLLGKEYLWREAM